MSRGHRKKNIHADDAEGGDVLKTLLKSEASRDAPRQSHRLEACQGREGECGAHRFLSVNFFRHLPQQIGSRPPAHASH